MKHRSSIDLADPVQDDWGPLEHIYAVEVWTDMPESGGERLETISRATDFQVSIAAYRAAMRQRPGKAIIHLNGRHRMSCQTAPDPPLPLGVGRPGGGIGRIQTTAVTKRPPQAFRTRGVVSARGQVFEVQTPGLA